MKVTLYGSVVVSMFKRVAEPAPFACNVRAPRPHPGAPGADPLGSDHKMRHDRKADYGDNYDRDYYTGDFKDQLHVKFLR